MKLFNCAVCDNIIYFENRFCGRCHALLGYEPIGNKFLCEKLEPGAAPAPATFELCSNANYDACNWIKDPDSNGLCLACRFNGTIPDLADEERLALWRKIEVAKHRLFYSLLRWRLPLVTRDQDRHHGLLFHFLADPPGSKQKKVMTGHDNGLITIALSEADDSERESRRIAMGEPYRTLLGHFRHEVGHHYWDVLVRDGGQLESCRAMFGDDSQNYEEALARHYAEGSPPHWQDNFVSAYASCHPWEDFAETWAHYFHIVDTLEMANAFGMQIAPSIDAKHELTTPIHFDPYVETNLQTIVNAWLPFVFAINNINRTMGREDLYPFILSPRVVEKLTYIHKVIRRIP